MNDSSISTTGTVGAGNIQFFDSIQPPLKTDEYTIEAEQTVDNVVDDGEDPSYTATKKLTIDGPRFAINPAVIHSMWPPANQTGNYTNFLPNIVFKDFSLPWSRAINPKQATANEDTPWMGLLTLHQAEYKSKTPKVSTPQTVTAAKLVNPGNKILGPVLESGLATSDDKVTVIDMDLDLFQAIAPSLEELKYMSHSRAVNTDGKVILNMDEDGCFSLCTGNRLPEKGEDNLILMVSFEGHQDHLNGNTISGDYDKIRLVHLGSWEFTTTTFDREFLNMMSALCDAGNGGVKLIGMEASENTQKDDDIAKEALEIGYVGLQNKMRIGEQATSWYRSPLVPAPTKRESKESKDDGNYGPYIYSDHAIHYDPETGIFNHAYSAAWQIGRLLALSDATFARGIFNWRTDFLRSIVEQAQQKLTTSAAESIQRSIGNAETPSLQAATRTFFTDAFRKVEWDKLKTRQEKMLGDKLPGVLSKDDVQKIQDNGEDPLLALYQKIKK